VKYHGKEDFKESNAQPIQGEENGSSNEIPSV
jgi:hypothetical protein